MNLAPANLARYRVGLACHATRLIGRLSRRLGTGSGSTVGGRVGLLIDPHLLERLGVNKQVALVSGTNGKTTTSRLLFEALKASGEVASSSAGANMSAGLVSALSAAPRACLAVLEVDEAYLPSANAALHPAVIALLNLSRDQMDRISEVRLLAQSWRDALLDSPATIVANADDPLVVFAVRDCRHVIWVGAGSHWHHDAYHCPACDARIDYGQRDDATWQCSCGFARPEPDAWVLGGQLARGRPPIALPEVLPGRFNQANAAMAAIAATAFGVQLDDALLAMEEVHEVAGRYATRSVGPSTVRLLLAKNPAGWTELIELVRGERHPVVVSINAQIADGHDPSWLWDVPFEALSGRVVIASGERRLDLAVRLRHAGVEHLVIEDQLAAITATKAPRVDYIGNYTAFQQLRKALSAQRAKAPGKAPTLGETRAIPARRAAQSVTVPITHLMEDSDFARRPVRASAARSSASALRVVVVHPDLLGTYGDGGNGRILANRALWRGHRVELVLAASDVALPLSGDLYCLGGGEDGPQVRSATRLNDGRLQRAVDQGAVVLAVCAGFQIIGRTFPGADGKAQPGVGLIDVDTTRFIGPRAVGEVVAERAEPLFGATLPD